MRTQIINEESVFYIKRITKEFVKTVARVENADASNYRTFRLKERLRERFPQLVFHTPTVRNKSEIVYVECLSQGSVAESFLGEEIGASESDQELEGEVDIAAKKASHDYTGATLKDMFTVGLTLRNILRGLTLDWYDSWPPLASEFTAENVKKLVPPLLFNFIAWFRGFSDEPEDADYIQQDNKTTATIFSLCQDLVYAANKGKVQTPKSLALAMTVRQMTGCSSLIKILSGLGHCVSLSSTMAYDLAIAQATINTSNIIPREFVAGEYVNLVYDNIDFCEEISKQTHVTNGIIVQRKSVQKQTSSSDHTVQIKKTQRTVAMPATDIAPYSIGVKKTPKFQCIDLDPESLQLKVNRDSAETAYKLDLAYILIKHVCAATEKVLPGWTGFNTLLCKYIPDVP